MGKWSKPLPQNRDHQKKAPTKVPIFIFTHSAPLFRLRAKDLDPQSYFIKKHLKIRLLIIYNNKIASISEIFVFTPPKTLTPPLYNHHETPLIT